MWADVGWIIIWLATSLEPADVGSTLEMDIDDVLFIFRPVRMGFVTAVELAGKGPLLEEMLAVSALVSMSFNS
jgi:hypothetical protein